MGFASIFCYSIKYGRDVNDTDLGRLETTA